MWQHIEPADVDRAKESLGHRLLETLSRHAEEIEALQAKQTEEISVLEAKQRDIASLEALIERFAGEFQKDEEKLLEPAINQKEIGTGLESTNTDSNHESAQVETSEQATEPLPNGTDTLNIGYASPNFRAFRKLAS